GGNLASGREGTGGRVFTERIPATGGSGGNVHHPGASHHPDASIDSGTQRRFGSGDLFPGGGSPDTTRRTQLPGRDPLGRDTGSGGFGPRVTIPPGATRVLPGDSDR